MPTLPAPFVSDWEMAEMPDAAPDVAPNGFRSKIFTAAGFSGLSFASGIGLRLVSTIVLTRLLAPEVYGIFALVLVYRYIVEMTSDLGLRSVVLTREGALDTRFLQTCWTVSILRGVGISAVSGLIGLVIAVLQMAGIFSDSTAYTAPELPLAIAALGATSLIFGLQSMNLYAHERNMAFGRVTAGRVLSNFFGLIVTVALAYWWRSVWALVVGSAATAIFLTAYSHLAFSGPSMRLCFDRSSVRIIIDRGKWIVGHSILTATIQAADRLLLGLVMSSTTFGFYYIARQLFELIDGFINNVNAQMGLQVFTHILRARTEDFRRNYYRYRLFFDSISGLSAGFIYILAPLIVGIIYDSRYRDVAPMAQILILGVLLTGPLILRSAFSAERRFRRMMVLSLISMGTIWFGLVLAIFMMASIPAALVVIALHRLPEVILLWWFASIRGWLIFWREGIFALFFGAGVAVGWAVMKLWELSA